MDSAVTSAIIAGVVAIVAPILTLVAKDFLEQNSFKSVTGRRRILLGTWKGPLKRTVGRGEQSLNVEVTVEFTKFGKRILGRATFTPDGAATRQLDFIGGFLHDQILKLDYKHADPAVTQFGCYICRVVSTPDRKTLEGKYLAYGPDSPAIVYGSAVLEKQR